MIPKNMDIHCFRARNGLLYARCDWTNEDGEAQRIYSLGGDSFLGLLFRIGRAVLNGEGTPDFRIEE